MSDRIAHRPRYRTTQHYPQHPRQSRQDFLSTRWTYRRQNISYEKRPIGYGISLLPFGYHTLRTIFSLQA